MPRVWFNRVDSSSVEITEEEIAEAAKQQEVDVDDVDVIDLAYEKFTHPYLCAQCTGWGSDVSVDPGEWEVDENIEP